MKSYARISCLLLVASPAFSLIIPHSYRPVAKGEHCELNRYGPGPAYPLKGNDYSAYYTMAPAEAGSPFVPGDGDKAGTKPGHAAGVPVVHPTEHVTSADAPAITTPAHLPAEASHGDLRKRATTVRTSTRRTTMTTRRTTTSAKVTSTTKTSSPTATGGSTAPGFFRGVNIGNWLVLEKWMDDGTVFQGAFAGANDQWTFDSIPGAAQALQKHWSTWFTQADVSEIKSRGFNSLRIPIGYWAYDNPATSGTPYLTGADAWLERSLEWARAAGMKVMIDMHGSPGSQNGEAHSGHIGSIQWQQGNNLQKSTDILKKIVRKYGTTAYADVVLGIELVNEPAAYAPNSFEVSKQWAADAYRALWPLVQNKKLILITHDSFLGPQNFVPVARALGTSTTFGADVHSYQLYTAADNTRTQAQHIAAACALARDLAPSAAHLPVLVGEFGALTNTCVLPGGATAPAQNGACPAGSQSSVGDPRGWRPETVAQVRRYVEAQLDTWERATSGYFAWSWRGPGGWSVRSLIQVGAWPGVATQRMFPGQCS